MIRLACLVALAACQPPERLTCGPGTAQRGTTCVATDAGIGAPSGGDAGPAPLEPAAGLAYQLTHSENADPSLSPDGKRMVYISGVAGREQLFLADLDATHVTQLTRDDADHEDPAWSPTGGTIAYVRLADKAEVVHLVNIDGSGDVALTASDVRAIHPSWSPDGTLVAYCTDDDLAPPNKNDSDIFTIELAHHTLVRRITGGTNTYPRISPDGKRFAFRRMTSQTNSEVFVADLDGGHATNLTNSPAFDGWPAWSPDGAWLAFASNKQGNHEIFVMRPDGSDVRRVAPTEGRATSPAWTHDGHHILFSNCRRVDFAFDCEILVARAPV
jgi:TolB protein